MSEPLSVAMVANIPTPYRDRWCDALAERPDVELTVIYLGPGHPRRRQWSQGSARHRRVLASTTVFERGERALHPVLRARPLLEPISPTFVLIGGWDQPLFWTARRAALASGAGFVPVIESHSRSGSWRGRLSTTVRSAFLRDAAAVIAMSDDAAAYVRSLGHDGPVLLAPQTVVPPAAPSAAIARPATPADPGTRTMRLLFLGALNRRKNPERVVEVARVLAGRGHDVVVDLVGAGAGTGRGPGPGDEGPMATGDVEVVRWGFLEGDDLGERWAGADCLVTPSREDAGPVVLLEAAARGLPFVASDRCGTGSTMVALGAVGERLTLEAPLDEWADAVERMAVAPGRVVTDVLPDPSAERVALFLRSLAPTIR